MWKYTTTLSDASNHQTFTTKKAFYPWTFDILKHGNYRLHTMMVYNRECSLGLFLIPYSYVRV
jgi:hypothetical protein